MTARGLLDPDEALRRLETQLGPLHAQLRLGMEREHEAQAFGPGLSFLHLENLPLMQAIIEIALRATGTYWLGLVNAGKVQLRRNIVRLANLPGAFDGFTILHLSDLNADVSGPAMRRAAGFVRATAGRLRRAQHAQTQAATRPRGRSTWPTRRSAFVCKPGG